MYLGREPRGLNFYLTLPLHTNFIHKAEKALTYLHICIGLHESLLPNSAISTKILCAACSNYFDLFALFLEISKLKNV